MTSLVAVCAMIPTLSVADVGSNFTFQGRLVESEVPVHGACGLAFTLWDAEQNGVQVAPAIFSNDTVVSYGYFSVELDFGAGAFDGADRWIEVTVDCSSGAGNPTVLSPRQRITPVPYAMHTRGISVDDAGNVGLGTPNPRGRLEVNGPVYIKDSLVLGLNQSAGYLGILEEHPAKNERVKASVSNRAGYLEVNDANNRAAEIEPSAISLYSNHGVAPDIQLYVFGSSKIRANGYIESAVGGFVFPDGTVQTTAAFEIAPGTLGPWLGPDGNEDVSYTGDVNIGGGASAFDGGSERLKIRGQSAEWSMGVKNFPAAGDADFWIGRPTFTDALTITPDGNVGIGNENPDAKLTVAGDVHLTIGGIRFPNGTFQATAAGGSGVTSLNAKTGSLELRAGPGISIYNSPIDDPDEIWIAQSGNRITSINGETGPSITFVEGENIDISAQNNTITITAVSGPPGSGVDVIKVNSPGDTGARGTVLLRAAGGVQLERSSNTITISSPPAELFCTVTNNCQSAQSCTCGTGTTIVNNQQGPCTVATVSMVCEGICATSRCCVCAP